MKGRGKELARAGLALLVPVLIFYLFEWYTHNPFEDIRGDIQIFNIIFFELLMLLFYSLFGRLHLALLLESIFFMLYGLANYFVLSFRSKPILPWDFFSIKTAAGVAGDFSYTLDAHAAAALTGFIVLLGIELLFCRNRLKDILEKYYDGPLKSWAFRIPAAGTALILLWLFVSLLHDEEFVQQDIRMYDKLFTPTVMSERDGTLLAFLLELQYIAVEKPDGYEREEAAAMLQAIETGSENVTAMPNIIVIMDEAFSDPAILGEFETNMDYMSFFHSMQKDGENAVTGTLYVSVKGGNTANTEFEFLTGHSMAFLPEGSVPYQQYINEEQPSLASYLASLGYITEAAHPYTASGWERDEVYPLLGFSRADFIKSFTNAERLRKYVSDESAFDYIIQRYEAKAAGEPLFFFEVTMQNHSGYTEQFDNFTPDILIEGSDSPALRQYLSLLKETDRALESLIDYFAEQEEPAIVVFFGDHQPADSVVEPIWRLQGKMGSDLTEEEDALRYRVPFLIWANYDIEEAQGLNLSVNYLGTLLLDTAGLPLSAYQSYLSSLQQEIPVISAREMITADGTDGSDNAALGDYRKLQYYIMFDRE